MRYLLHFVLCSSDVSVRAINLLTGLKQVIGWSDVLAPRYGIPSISCIPWRGSLRDVPPHYELSCIHTPISGTPDLIHVRFTMPYISSRVVLRLACTMGLMTAGADQLSLAAIAVCGQVWLVAWIVSSNCCVRAGIWLTAITCYYRRVFGVLASACVCYRQ